MIRRLAPIRALRHALAGEIAPAMDALEEACIACAPAERAEAVLDVGEALVSRGGERAQIERYLVLSREVAHRGVRYRVEDLRAELFARIGDAGAARYTLGEARRELERLTERIEGDDYRERLADHPWVKALRRVRAVP